MFDWQGGRHVGRVADYGEAVQRFALPPGAAAVDGVAALIGRDLPLVEDVVPIVDVAIQAPIPRPRRNIFCVGKNYREHAKEFAHSGFDSSAVQGVVPGAPIVFSKLPESVIPHGAEILLDPAVTEAVDYEAELAVIVGAGGRNIPQSEAMKHVWGYTIANDVTARDLQSLHSQWLIGKSQDTFCPMGPAAVKADEIDLADTPVRCRVNGELRQASNTALMIFDVPAIIAAISNGITLMPGDVIATGTPAGVGIGFTPPKYLRAGDRVAVEIGGIGVLENPVAEI
ncbi:MAG: fumarylacetoacetate hydrolase family protein [Rhodospirillaceae bacterium]|nr:fumarylacetoacetate hydrolase family protein [Rhodospirillaceae bacterium]